MVCPGGKRKPLNRPAVEIVWDETTSAERNLWEAHWASDPRVSLGGRCSEARRNPSRHRPCSDTFAATLAPDSSGGSHTTPKYQAPKTRLTCDSRLGAVPGRHCGGCGGSQGAENAQLVLCAYGHGARTRWAPMLPVALLPSRPHLPAALALASRQAMCLGSEEAAVVHQLAPARDTHGPSPEPRALDQGPSLCPRSECMAPPNLKGTKDALACAWDTVPP